MLNPDEIMGGLASACEDDTSSSIFVTLWWQSSKSPAAGVQQAGTKESLMVASRSRGLLGLTGSQQVLLLDSISSQLYVT